MVALAAVALDCGAHPGSAPRQRDTERERPPEHPIDSDRESALGGGRTLVTTPSGACAIGPGGRVQCWGAEALVRVPDGAFTALAAGDRHVCGLRTDRHAVCWGEDAHGDTRPPSDALVAIDAAGALSCGLRASDMKPVCWGNDDSGRRDVVHERMSALVMTDPTTCGLRANGTAACWGLDASDQPLDGAPFTALAVGSGLRCGLRSDGTLRCAGMMARDVPSGRFRTIGGGRGGMCGTSIDGAALCFGYDSVVGQLRPPPGRFRRVAAGRRFACGIRENGSLACWSPDRQRRWPLPSGTFTDLAVGEDFGCARRADGGVRCFGDLYAGQGSPPAGRFRAVAGGARHACAIREDGTLACWGANEVAESTPPAGAYRAVACSASRSCAIKTDGVLTCWGAGMSGASAIGQRVRAIAMGEYLDCAVMSSGTVRCWGDNSQGLNVSSVRDAQDIATASNGVYIATRGARTCFGHVQVPTGGMPGVEWQRVECPAVGTRLGSASDRELCGIDGAGALTCGAIGLFGSLGSARPPAPRAGGPFTSVSTGWEHGCGVGAGGRVRCWGSNAFAESSPPDGAFRAVAVGRAHACAIRDSDAALVCWGSYAGTPM